MFWWEWKFPKDTFFITFPDLEQKKIWLLAKCFSALLSKLHFASSVYHSDVFSEQFSFLPPFRNPSKKYLDFCSKDLRKTCQTAVYVYRRVYRDKIGIWRKISTFFDFWPLGIKKITSVGKKKLSTVLRTDFYAYRGSFRGDKFLE